MFRSLWIQVRSSLWFVPAVLVFGGAAMALLLVQLDIIYLRDLSDKRWELLLNTGSDGARGMLSAIASSMITVAGVAFSVTIVSLSLASSQYTPRILRNFMSDRGNQFVLGTFVAIFTYCLIVLRTIRASSEDEDGFVPLLAVAFALVLALFSIGCLIYFIHHTAASIQASTILKAVADETGSAIRELHPEELAPDAADDGHHTPPRNVAWRPGRAQQSGYLQHGDGEELWEFAQKHDTLLRLERHAGDFVGEGMPLISTSRNLDAAAAKTLQSHFVIGDFRTIDQDAAFGIRQIVDIALKALSPSVNDTSTAVSCLDYLSVLLMQLANRRLQPPFVVEEARMRIFSSAPTFEDFVALSFDEIRLAGRENVALLLQMLRCLQRIAEVTRNASRQEVLVLHARLIIEAADATVAAPYDRARINEDIAALRGQCGAGASTLPQLDLPAASTS
ncbi:DUF2254 domain-containing protein [soil metagenome]